MLNFLRKNKWFTLILVLAALLRFVGVIPNIQHPDESYIVDYSGKLVTGILTHGDFNPHTFKYGSPIFYINSLFYMPIALILHFAGVLNTAFFSSFSSGALPLERSLVVIFYKQANVFLYISRFITASLGVGSIILLYKIANKLFNRYIALISALVLTISPMHVRDSHYATTDVPSVFFLLLSNFLLLKMTESKKGIWFFVAGISLGLSATIKYFPVGFVIYPIFVFLSFSKSKAWLRKFILSMLGIGIGIFLGLPFLFLDPSGPQLLQADLEKYVLPWYSTSVSTYIFSLASYIISLGKTTLPSLETLRPQFLHVFFASFLFFQGLGPILAVMSLTGIAVALKRHTKSFLLLSPIPLVTFLYATFYIPATYERTVLPVLAYLTIFCGVLIYYLVNWTNSFLKTKIFAFCLIVLLLGVSFAPPLVKSVTSVKACSEPYINVLVSRWADANISAGSSIASLPMVSLPNTKDFGEVLQLDPARELSLEEVAGKGKEYAFLNTARLEYETYPLFNNFFVPSDKVYENSYYSLVLAEYKSRATLLGVVEKPRMCDISRVVFYKLPDRLQEANKTAQSFDFSSEEQINFWQPLIVEKGAMSQNVLQNTKEGKTKKGSLEYIAGKSVYGIDILKSKPMPFRKNQIYTFKGWVKSGTDLSKLIFRMDFYRSNPADANVLKKNMYLIYEGPSLLYYEKVMPWQAFTETSLPGKIVALSPKTEASPDMWKPVSVTASAPEFDGTLTLSVQGVDGKPKDIYLDDITLSSGSKND